MIDHSAALADPARLAALAAYDLDDPRLRTRLDALAARTAEAVGAPVGLVSLVLDSAQHLAGSSGLTGWMAETGGTPVEWSFCANAVVEDRPYVVQDASTDPLQHDNPLVTHDGIASYAGVPLRTRDGHVLGAQCVLDTAAHRFGPEEIAVLEAAAAQAVAILDEHRTGA
ncbi:GAF domain-containing protein [Kineococcus sp. SYSU DK006]|uniref:GAF domain-containing protein n=1 Tax=Kineococcus sp. SYSU DK006 TaxID=3383127 RepID=UPI003D7E022A